MADGTARAGFDFRISGSDIAGAWGVDFDTSDTSRFGGVGVLRFGAIGDVNGDGLDDIAAGSRWASSRDFVTVGNFTVFSAHAADAADGVAKAELLFRTPGQDSLLEGFSFSATGDFDGDGNREMLVGRDPRVFAEDGAADQGQHVFHEITIGGLIPGTRFSTMGGTETDFVGDINGDGFDDLLVTDLTGHRIVLGNADGALDDVVELDGSTGFAAFTLGRAVAGGEDMDGDGTEDLAVLLRTQSALRLAHGGENLAGIDLGGADDGFLLSLPATPTNVEMLSDFDGDGRADILVSWRGGAAVLLDAGGFSGELSLDELDDTQALLIDFEGINQMARAAGDLNGDGLSDINWSHRNPDGRVDVGVLFGGVSHTGPVELADLNGTNGFAVSGARVGQSVGDVNGDGVDDLMLRTADASGSRMSILFGKGPTTGSQIGGNGPGAESIAAGALHGTVGDDELFGGLADDFITGGRGSDALYGGGGADTLRGGDANDILVGGSGADVLNGGDGQDTADYSSASSAVFVRLMTSEGLAGDAAGDEVRFIENLSGSDFGDRLYGSDVANVLDGGAGSDRLEGHGGNDRLLGQTGNDTLVGGSGDDIVLGGEGDDMLRGDAGHDDLRGGGGSDHIDGGLGDDTLTGGDGADSLYGQEGADELFGEAGNDLLMDGGGDDLLSGGGGDDTLLGGGGRDTLFGGAGADQLRGEAGDDRLSGNDGDDGLRGGVGRDALFGGAGNDFLHGGADADTLNGGDGADTLSGGAGADLFVATPDAVVDTIVDFDQTEGDRLDLSALDLASGAISVTQDGAHLILSGDQFGVVLLNVAPGVFDLETAALF